MNSRPLRYGEAPYSNSQAVRRLNPPQSLRKYHLHPRKDPLHLKQKILSFKIGFWDAELPQPESFPSLRTSEGPNFLRMGEEMAYSRL